MNKKTKYVLEGKAHLFECIGDNYLMFIGEDMKDLAEIALKDGWTPKELEGKRVKVTLELTDEKFRYVQKRNPMSGEYIKIDTIAGKILDSSKEPFKNVRIVK